MANSKEKQYIFTRSGQLLYQKYREFFLPTILASMSSSMALIVDSVLVGNMLGADEMASVNLCMPVMQFFITFAILVGLGSSTLISVALGKRNLLSANSTFTIALSMILVLGCILTLLSVPFYSEIASILTTDARLLPYVASYLQILSYGSIFILLIPMFAYIIRTDGMAKLASIILIVANVANLLLDILFMGACGMGIAGSALATVCGYAIGTITTISYWKSNRRTLNFNINTFKNLQQMLTQTLCILKAGSPGALSSVLILFKIFFLNLLIGHIAGSQGLVVFSVCISALSFVSMFISGTAGTMMPIIGILYGERDFKGIRLLLRYTIQFAMILTGSIVVLFELLPEKIFALFGVIDPELIAIGAPSFRIFSLSLIGVTPSFLMIYYYMTIQRSTIANLLSTMEGLLIIIPASWLLSLIMGINGIWVAFILAELFTLLSLYPMVRRVIRKSNGEYNDLLLIKHTDPELIYDVSLQGTQHNAVNISKDAREVLKNNAIDNQTALQVGIALEEMVDNTRSYQSKRKKKNGVDIDIRISASDHQVTIAMRDNGEYFNPLEYKADHSEYSIDGITLLKAVANEIKYNRVLNLNQTQIVVNKQIVQTL